jgi:hypothetical protein
VHVVKDIGKGEELIYGENMLETMEYERFEFGEFVSAWDVSWFV